MHNWLDERVDWDGINGAARYIAIWLKTWFRVSVMDSKEKYGTVRVYCHFGWNTFYEIFYPGYYWVQQWWPYRFDVWFSHHTPLLRWINLLVVPIHKFAYRYRYKKAIQKWPHLKKEIVCCADYPELLK